MKVAIITDFHGFPIIEEMGLSYHLVLGQYVLGSKKYLDFYSRLRDKGNFIMMDNGTAEGALMSSDEMYDAIEKLQPDEIVLPDVMKDANATIKASTGTAILDVVPPIKRAVVPQGTNAAEWIGCASFFVANLEFATMCIPKHTESFVGGRLELLGLIHDMGWHKSYNIHMLGCYENPYYEISAARALAPWVRGIDTAAPFAHAQHLEYLTKDGVHRSHEWWRTFDWDKAKENCKRLVQWATEPL